MTQGLRKYLKILRISLVERLAYRADFFLTTFLRFLPLITTFLLWEAIYRGSGTDQIAGFTRDSMIAYLLLVQISRMFSSMPGLSTGIARDIRDGNLKKYLLQPIDMLWYLLSYRGAHKIAYIATTALPYGVLFLLFHEVFTLPSAWTWVAYIVSLLLAFLIGFFFEACIGVAGFWILEVTSLMYIINIVNFFISGQMFPLDLLERYPYVLDVLNVLPFHYLAYFPAMVFLEKKQGTELLVGLLIEALWALALILLSRWMYRLGLRHYSAYGG
ncbi:MAG: ABC-2 family transporter protein [Planctomycetes bacterium]|nr:ABC-2 family transporter protein [Planctomycetota bacterium]